MVIRGLNSLPDRVVAPGAVTVVPPAKWSGHRIDNCRVLVSLDVIAQIRAVENRQLGLHVDIRDIRLDNAADPCWDLYCSSGPVHLPHQLAILGQVLEFCDNFARAQFVADGSLQHGCGGLQEATRQCARERYGLVAEKFFGVLQTNPLHEGHVIGYCIVPKRAVRIYGPFRRPGKRQSQFPADAGGQFYTLRQIRACGRGGSIDLLNGGPSALPIPRPQKFLDGRVEIKIGDTGSGIPKENLSKIFDPFFTTKDVGKGTGLGLNMAYNIIKKHNGTIDVESEVGKGTTFTIRIPVE